MFNKKSIDCLIESIYSLNGKYDKKSVANMIVNKFNLKKDRAVYYCEDFAIRFSQSKFTRASNTITALSRLKNYDNRPFFSCVVSQNQNSIMLANTTFLKRISQSSHNLKIDNIKGSFNSSDIMDIYEGVKNIPANFEQLFLMHSKIPFSKNLERLVESTNGIKGRKKKFLVTDSNRLIIEKSVDRAVEFINSMQFELLKADLDNRVRKVQNQVIKAMHIDNTNFRGRTVEFLITENDSELKQKVINALDNNSKLPVIMTKDCLGDYEKTFDEFITQTDIKSKNLSLSSNPKGYNIDKLLEFLANDKSVYLIYFLGVDENNEIVSKLCSMFDENLIGKDTKVSCLWAGRDSRGEVQFYGKQIEKVLSETNNNINTQTARDFIKRLISR